MSMYARMRAMVIRNLGLLEQGGHGSELSITRTTSVFDPATSKTVKTTKVYLTTALRNNYRNFDLKDSTIKDTDVNFYVSPVCTTEELDPDWVPDTDLGETEEDRPLIDVAMDTPELLTNDALLFLGHKYNVINVRPWNHAGISIGFKVQGRVAA